MSERPYAATRRGFLATVAGGLVPLAGCSASASTETPTEELAEVSFGWMTGHAVDPETYNTTFEDTMQITATLDDAAEGVLKVETTVITGAGSQTGTWLVPQHVGEDRTLGSRNVYDEDDVVNPRDGDWIEVRAWKGGESHRVEAFEIETNDE